MDTAFELPKKRQLPKLMACMTKNSIENFRSKVLFSLDTLDAKGIRRRKLPLHECLILELRESGFFESSDYLQDLIYDNVQILAEDEIGIVIDIRERVDFLEHISAGLQRAERERDKDNKKKEAVELLKLALHYSEQGKGILWLAEKFFLAAIAVSSHYLADGGRQKACCKYHYASFLLSKFSEADPDEPFEIFTDVRDSAIGKDWPLFENEEEAIEGVPNCVFIATVLKLHDVMLNKARSIRDVDPAKAERLSRLAERRAKDAADIPKIAEAVVEIGISQLAMNSLNNAQRSFEKAFKIYSENNDINGLCETKMHLAAVMQRLGEHEEAAKLLTGMGALAMENGLVKQLGRALQLLGELHLRRERPDLGTQHLAEAFTCFMGYMVHGVEIEPTTRDIGSNGLATLPTSDRDFPLITVPLSQGEIPKSPETGDKGELKTDLDVIYKKGSKKIHVEEAEQARIMMAISAGQELMASYFKLIDSANSCFVAKIQVIEWKLAKSRWWIEKDHHKLIPCSCPNHKRSPLDILWLKMSQSDNENILKEVDESILNRASEIDDIRQLRSTFITETI